MTTTRFQEAPRDNVEMPLQLAKRKAELEAFASQERPKTARREQKLQKADEEAMDALKTLTSYLKFAAVNREVQAEQQQLQKHEEQGGDQTVAMLNGEVLNNELERLKGAKKKLEDELVATREEYEQLVQDLTTKAESARKQLKLARKQHKHECVQFNLKFDKDDKRIEALKAEVAALRSTQEQQQQERERMQTQEQQLQVQTLELQALTEHSQTLEQQNAALVNKLDSVQQCQQQWLTQAHYAFSCTQQQLETAMQAGLEIEQRAEALEQQLGALHAYLEEQQQEQQKEQLNYQQQEQEKH
ncbi:hypothetical protein JG688_00013928 [Phytophthora aleatoria]|uniref:Uncharacterized protein n=1 Tax=Phytophthora aleatoria TaxID=2496075 RepID=A0A8J5ME76_9STRA|nr:hypothetical protein JG688_00013928 [Phytophthora aleatoria]